LDAQTYLYNRGVNGKFFKKIDETYNDKRIMNNEELLLKFDLL